MNNKELDRLTGRLFVSRPLSPEAIDSIVADPNLFASVRRRIALAQAPSVRRARLSASARQQMFAFGSIAVIVLSVAGAVILSRPQQPPKTAPGQIVSSKIPDSVPEVARPVIPPQGNQVGKLSAGRATKDDDFRVERAIVRRRSVAGTPAPEVVEMQSANFLPVSYTGDPADLSAGAQVIRVELKRSSLFALGVDLPLENDDAMVKADLVVGRDGVTRAVRIVN